MSRGGRRLTSGFLRANGTTNGINGRSNGFNGKNGRLNGLNGLSGTNTSTSESFRHLAVGPLKKDGSPDLRYKRNRHLRKRKERPAVVSIESTIAGGKSTLLRRIRDCGHFSDCVIAEEPLHMWQDVRRARDGDTSGDTAAYNMLDHMYSDLSRWGYSFQIWALFTRVKTLENHWAEMPTDCQFLLSERCWKATNRIFAKCMKESGAFSEVEWEMYQVMFEWLDTSAPLTSGYIFIEQDLETAMERMRVRSRSEETEVSEEYQRSIIEQHRSWREELQAEGTPVLVLDGNMDLGTNDETFREHVPNQVREFLGKVQALDANYESQRRAVFETQRLKHQKVLGDPPDPERILSANPELYQVLEQGLHGPAMQFFHEKCGIGKGR